MYGFDLCEIPVVLQVVYFIKILINLVKFFVPMGLIVMISIDFLKGVIGGEKKAGDILRASGNKLLAAVLIFLVPTIVDFSLGLVDRTISYESCWTNAEISSIETYQALWDKEVAKVEAEEEQKREEERKKEELETLKKEEEEVIRKEEEEKRKEEQSINVSDNGSSENSSNSSNSSTSSSSNTYKTTTIDTTDLGCTLYYDRFAGSIKKSLSINNGEAGNLHDALVGACSYVKSVGYNYIQTGGTMASGGYHAKGLAIDLNNQWAYYGENGKKYMPYGGQGTNTWYNYKKFICDVCDGKENCKYNINYQIFIKYFKPKGWCWGGNWGAKYFDPMHFEKRPGGCSVASNRTITCD